MKSLTCCWIAFVSFVAAACAADVDESVVAKIAVKADGTVFFDGLKVEFRELERLLTPIQEKRGVVWYYRASPRGGPHPVALEVMKLVVAKRLPIKMFFTADFSEPIGADGRPQKRPKG